MVNVESIKKKIQKLNILIILVSILTIFLLQIILNRIEFSKIGHYLYPDFWEETHYLFMITSTLINICVPLFFIYFLTRYFYKKEILNNIIHMNNIIQGLKDKDLDKKIEKTNIKEFNDIISEIEEIQDFLRSNIKEQLTIQNNFKRKLEVFEHDLKTPLTVLQGHTELLRKINESKLPDEIIREKISKESEIISNSLYRVNDQIKIHINNINMLPENTDLISIKDIVEILNKNYNNEYILKSKVLNINMDDEFLSSKYFINSQILYHVIDNLINNALKYSDKIVYVKLQYIPTNSLKFSVINDGKLFSSEEINSAKEWGVKSKESNGSGIGLYFASEVLKQFDSDVFINNEDGKAVVSFVINTEVIKT
ncbi:sensor histidine kinase [Macrococcoides caseolyticum]|uniref:sensor histidine kinase n=1 Tax=Macrococcoides caseolyticum TaxID=69966 RepID=UPI001F3E1C8B|nr:HAMP domain-containing sensor histidine kinase [Macrococcus caseolyticus]MCE4957811.1 HAMP domain-containing histidine kinase [Macrococcus caseolyticus]